MGDSRRFDIFASFIESKVSNKNALIADVAAGKGYLSLALKQRGFKNVISFEPNPRGNRVRKLNLRAHNFTGGKFDVIIGMHPDQATDIILHEAALHKAMAFVVPCCAFGTRWTFWNVPVANRRGIPAQRQEGTYTRWLEHLERESLKYNLTLSRENLPIKGRNIVLFGKGR